MKTITKDQYLMALGLFMLAQEGQKKTREYEHALTTLLGVEDGSHVTDAVYDRDDTLDAALEREKIAVEGK